MQFTISISKPAKQFLMLTSSVFETKKDFYFKFKPGKEIRIFASFVSVFYFQLPNRFECLCLLFLTPNMNDEISDLNFRMRKYAHLISDTKYIYC